MIGHPSRALSPSAGTVCVLCKHKESRQPPLNQRRIGKVAYSKDPSQDKERKKTELCTGGGGHI